jgi:hypothetical protein
MNDMELWSKETMDKVTGALRKDASQQGYTTGLGLTNIELAEYARVLIPSLTPFRNSLPRTPSKVGSLTTMWRSILSANTTNLRPTLALGSAGVTPNTQEADFMASYSLISQGGRVMRDARMLAEGFDDLQALSVQNTLIDLMKQEEIILLGGQNFTLGTPAAPTLVPASSGGSIGAVNVSVAVAMRTLQGVQDGQSTAASTPQVTGALTGYTNGSVTATAAWLPGAMCYDWYVGLAGGSLYYYGTTTINSITITSVPTQAATATGAPSVPSVPGANSVNTTTGVITFTAIATASACNVDNSADTNSMNGFIATLVGGFSHVGNANILVQNGTGSMASGASVTSLNGASLIGNGGTILQIDNVLDSLWQAYKVSPSKIYCNSRTKRSISDLMVSSGGTTTLVPIQSPDQRIAAVGGVIPTQYANKAGEGFLDIVSLPWIPQGTVIIATEKLSFPNSRVNAVFDVECQMDYTMTPYPANKQYGTNGGPRYEYDVAAIETFRNFFSGAHAVIQNVGV